MNYVKKYRDRKFENKPTFREPEEGRNQSGGVLRPIFLRVPIVFLEDEGHDCQDQKLKL
jgi:hypothetical protein